MKHIKKFEKYKPWENDDKYWEITLLRPYFNLSLKKIGVPDDLIEEWDDMYQDKEQIVYLYKEYISNYDRLRDDYDIMTDWSIKTEKNNRDVAKFMGRIKIEDFEIDINKFNL